MKKTIFITGVTGVMGAAGLKELYSRLGEYAIKALVRRSKANIRKMSAYPEVDVTWGDLTDYDSVLRGVTGADIVLHVGGMVSPKADYRPLTTRKVNVSAAENIVRAVNAQPNADHIKVVYIGSVAQTSDRNAPIHWGRTGDPICISVYDHYAITKTIAERIIVEGVKNWVCLRQSGILYPGILKNYDPIMFHVPINGVLEWATVEDSGRLLAKVCEDAVPDSFWRNFYNIGSGDSFRITNYQFEQKLLRTISCPKPEKLFNANWFVLRNFHGQWYADSDRLNDILGFRENITCDEYFTRMRKQVPWYYHLAVIVPAAIIKHLAMKPLAHTKNTGTMWWIKNRDAQRISAFYGSYEKWAAIPNWDNFDTTPPTKQITLLDHGYDETKSTLNIDDIKQAARFRGGECLSESMGAMSDKLEWQCQFGHRFTASAHLVLKGGHWCEECLPAPWNYNEIAKGNPFFAQVWYPLHEHNETDSYGADIYEHWEQPTDSN